MADKFRLANLSLSNKVLLPYVILLLVLAIATSIGSSVLLKTRLIKTSEEHLEHNHKQIYGEFKALETVLSKRATEVKNMGPKTLNEIQTFLSAYDQHITASISSSDDPQLPKQLKSLLLKALANKTTYIAFTHEQEGDSLVACLLLETNRYLFLRHPIDRPYLDKMAERYKSDFYLLNRHGELITSNHAAKGYVPELSEAELATLQSGAHFSNIISGEKAQLIIYSPLPLGHEGFFLLGTAQPLAGIEKLIFNHRLYLMGIAGLSLLICVTLFRSLLSSLLSPLNSLISTCSKITSGDRTARVDVENNNPSQLTNLGSSYNQLLDLLDEKDNHLELLSDQLQKMADLKTHNQHLRKTNLELENRAISLKEQNQEFSALFQITQTMVSSLDQRLLYERIIQALKDSLHCNVCVLYIFSPGSDTLDAVKVQGLYGVDLKNITIELGKGLAGEAALNQKMTYAPDLTAYDEKPRYSNETIDEGSLLCVPMTVQNRLIGVINLHQSNKNSFSSTAQKIAQAIANQAAIAIENARLYEKTKTLSATDELTGLSNRRQFQEYLLRELAQSRRHHNNFSILMIDIDHFKLYNDSHGHLKGDIVLKRVASLLLQNTRGVDLVARFGGEEFVLLLPKSDKLNSLAVAEKLRMCIEKEYFSGAENSQPGQRLTISIGVSHFPSDSSDIYDLMNLADTALYQAKNQGRNKCIGWNPTQVPEGH